MFKELEKTKEELYHTKQKIIEMQLHFQEEFRNIIEIADTNYFERDDIKLNIIQKIAIINMQKLQKDLSNM